MGAIQSCFSNDATPGGKAEAARNGGYGATGTDAVFPNGTSAANGTNGYNALPDKAVPNGSAAAAAAAATTGRPVDAKGYPVFVRPPMHVYPKTSDPELLFDNNLGLPSTCPLWLYKDRHMYDSWEGVTCLGRVFSLAEQVANAKRLIDLMSEVKRDTAAATADPLMSGITFNKPKKLKLYNAILEMFGLAETPLQRDCQIELQIKLDEFIEACRAENLNLPDRELFRASTNAWPMFCIQYLNEGKMYNCPSITGFSLLYPLTDDVYDNPDTTRAEKEDFGARLGRRIAGDLTVPTKNSREDDIWRMIGLVEMDCSHETDPEVFIAMDGLNRAQIASMDQLISKEQEAAGLVDDEMLWDRIARKGAGSILADATIVYKKMTPDLVSFSSLFGSTTQWLNDVKSIAEDYEERQLTPYSSEWFVRHRQLDTMQKQVICYVHDTFTRPEHKRIWEAEPEKLEFLHMLRCFLLMKVLEGIAINQDKHSPEFLKAVEMRSPVSLDTLAQIRGYFVEKVGK